MNNKNEIIIYQSDGTTQLEVRLEDETVWLSQNQMSILFQTSKQNISLHVNNIYKEQELAKFSTVKHYLTVQLEGKRQVERMIEYYNLDVIISVGYRVKSKQGTQFRIWANRILKEYLLKGYAVNQRIDRLEQKLYEHNQKLQEHDQKFDFFIKTSLPPIHGIFYDGQVFDAYIFMTDLVKSAKQSLVLIDNYVDESILLMLSKRTNKVRATIYTNIILSTFRIDIKKHNSQYPPIEIKQFSRSHDRFLIIDDSIVYHIGASLKDLGKRWFAFSKIDIDAKQILDNIKS